MPSVKAFFTNMAADMPTRRKLRLVFRNNLIKMLRRENCCGHPGEPGCCETSLTKHSPHPRNDRRHN